MRAIVIKEPGDEDVLQIGEAPSPPLGAEEIRIRVRATSVNRADLLQRRGFYPPPPGASTILGLECAGEVAEIGGAVPPRFSLGDRVMALLPGGGYAAEAVVHHGSAMRVPTALDLKAAGGFLEVFLTVHLNVFQIGGVKQGGTILVHGGGSGVGTAAIQLAREAGVRCLVTAGTDEKCARCTAFGASAAINYNKEDFAARVRELTSGEGVDVILDCVGGSYLEANLQSLKLDGALVVIGLTGGASGTLHMGLLLTRRLRVIGSTLRTRPVAEKALIVQGFEAQFGAALAAGRLQVPIERVFPLAQAADAHRLVASGTHFGKVLLEV